GWVPANQQHVVQAAKISLDYTAVLNILFGAVAAVLVVMFLRSDGPRMMRMMSGDQEQATAHSEHAH
ncbi:MAG: permease, partial [Pseudomonadota bacterium]|nr:permease [Pseudomonadota bacterium]